MSTSVFILGFAGLEYSIGILLMILFKNLNNSMEIKTNKNENDIYNTNNLYVNRYFVNK
jgi:hypothetical protein